MAEPNGVRRTYTEFSDLLQSDPCVDWTSDGTAWAITIGYDGAQTHLRLRSFKSTNGGASWAYDANASGNQTAADKEMMWVDHSPTSPFKDNIYVIWLTNDDRDPYGALVGAYYLLKYKVSGWPTFNQIARLLEIFLQRFDASPDVALLCAWIALQSPKSARSDASWLDGAKKNFGEAAVRGIPTFALGLRYLSETIRVIIASGELSAENRPQLEKASQRLGRYLQATDEYHLFCNRPFGASEERGCFYAS